MYGFYVNLRIADRESTHHLNLLTFAPPFWLVNHRLAGQFARSTGAHGLGANPEPDSHWVFR